MPLLAFLDFFQTVVDAVEFVNGHDSGCQSGGVQGDLDNEVDAVLLVDSCEFHSG